jgi:metallo-beta-lactamase family protein
VNVFFHGATRSVSGSLHLLEVQGRRWLLDCGLFQGRRQDMYDCNAGVVPEPARLTGVILSHAHVDHSGRLPRLVKLGYRGPIYASPATIDLCALLLDDSAYVLRTQTRILNLRRAQRNLPPLPDLYGEEDVAQTLQQMAPVAWGAPVTLAPGLSVEFLPAGHILGASIIVVREESVNGRCTLVFSGDIGRAGDWILPDPAVVAEAQHVIVESTYGDKTHRPYPYARAEFARNIGATLRGGGIVVIPAFSVGRTQRVIYELHAMMTAGELPATPVYVDSPLSVEACTRFVNHADALRPLPEGTHTFTWLDAHNVVSSEESRQLRTQPGPFIVITASGMCEAGRVLHHLSRSLPDAASRVVFVGFCAEGTLGRWLRDGHDSARINGDVIPVRAAIDQFDSFSSHADQPGLLDWVCAHSAARSVFLVHGEEPQTFALAEQLERRIGAEVIVPFAGEGFALTPYGVHSVLP